MKNELGESKVVFELLIKSQPDAPTDLRLINVTLNSVTLSWTVNFDGGEFTVLNLFRYFFKLRLTISIFENTSFRRRTNVISNSILC